MKTMKANKRVRRFSLFSVLVVLLSVLLVVLLIVAAVKTTPTRGGYQSRPSSILFDLQKGRYSDALSAVKENRALGFDESSDQDYAAPYAVCDYYEACSYYTAFKKTGDEENAAYYEKLMAQAFERMGSLQYMAEAIASAWD